MTLSFPSFLVRPAKLVVSVNAFRPAESQPRREVGRMRELLFTRQRRPNSVITPPKYITLGLGASIYEELYNTVVLVSEC